MNFNVLISQIETTHHNLQAYAVNAINVSLTVRNYLFGFYIVEFEQNGEDRAKYGEKLLENIAERLKHIKGLSYRSLNMFRQFYVSYPQILQLLIAESQQNVSKILQTASAESLIALKSDLAIIDCQIAKH